MAANPIKRSEYIIALSRDHHAGLLFCWKIKEGVKKGAELSRIKNYASFFWDNHLERHFLEEESLLFNEVDDHLTQQGKSEHRVLRRWFDRIKNDEIKSGQDYVSLTEMLIKHIRYEERVLFPHLETVLPVNTLAGVGSFLQQQHPVPFKDEYPDEFWVDVN
jgi:hemerythrin-like domain-containing protein